MAALPLQKTDIQPLSLMQTTWKSILDPVVANPMTNMLILKNISLSTGPNVINHRLGRLQQGWQLVDVQGAATIYRNTPFNSSTLGLSSSANVVVSLGVF